MFQMGKIELLPGKKGVCFNGCSLLFQRKPQSSSPFLALHHNQPRNEDQPAPDRSSICDDCSAYCTKMSVTTIALPKTFESPGDVSEQRPLFVFFFSNSLCRCESPENMPYLKYRDRAYM